MIGLVGGIGGDADLRKAARPLADHWLADRSGLDPELVGSVLDLVARDGDPALYATVREQALAEKDRSRRETLLGALGSFSDPTLLAQNLDLVAQGKIDVREALGLVFTPLGNPLTRETQWALLRDHLDTIVPLVPVYARGWLPEIGGSFCDAVHREEVAKVFEKRAKAWLGGRHHLDEVLERTDRCIADLARRQPAIDAWLSTEVDPDAPPPALPEAAPALLPEVVPVAPEAAPAPAAGPALLPAAGTTAPEGAESAPASGAGSAPPVAPEAAPAPAASPTPAPEPALPYRLPPPDRRLGPLPPG